MNNNTNIEYYNAGASVKTSEARQVLWQCEEELPLLMSKRLT